MKTRRMVTSVLLLALVMALLPAQTARSATLTVTTNNDVLDAAVNCAAVTVVSLPGPDGVTSLREAICAANSNAGADTVDFNIPGAGVHIVDLLSALPQLGDNLTTIDGYAQLGAAPADEDTPATILIAINGTGIFNNGLNVTSSGNVIRGLAIYGFVGSEIYIANYAGSVANDNVIAGNYLGADASGVLCPDTDNKGLNGVFIGAGAQNNLIGGNSPADRNLISCNGWEGVGIHGSGTMGNVVSGNYIGVDPPGTTSRANTLDGVRIYGGAQNNTVGGDTPGERNIISGNARDGVRIVGAGSTGNLVTGNYIGLDPDGASDRSNDFFGVYIGGGAQNNLIGGDTGGERNVISGNELSGVYISDSGTTGNVVSGNYIGLAQNGAVGLPNALDGVNIEAGAQGNTIGGDTKGQRNVISANQGSGVSIGGAGTNGNIVSGNHIGTDPRGQVDFGNELYGVHIARGAQNNIIGGDRTAGEDNLISGNDSTGVFITDEDTNGNVVSGNCIGTDAAGMVALGNHSDGVRLTNDLHNNLIGGETAGERNIISGNGDDGVEFVNDAADNIVSGNYIGLAIHGTNPLPNADNGIELGVQAQNNTIGGDTPGERNIISSNGGDGVAIEGHDNIVSGNYIGTDARGTAARGNAGDGVFLNGDAENNVIGGDTPGERILISGNGDDGIALDGADNNTVSGNYIGVNASGTDVLANNDFGIYMGNSA